MASILSASSRVRLPYVCVVDRSILPFTIATGSDRPAKYWYDTPICLLYVTVVGEDTV